MIAGVVRDEWFEMRPAPRYVFPAVVLLVASACSAIGMAAVSRSGLTGIHKIQHVVIIMQENRSFDSYFGTFPGADGIPMRQGRPADCVPDPQID